MNASLEQFPPVCLACRWLRDCLGGLFTTLAIKWYNYFVKYALGISSQAAISGFEDIDEIEASESVH